MSVVRNSHDITSTPLRINDHSTSTSGIVIATKVKPSTTLMICDLV